MDNEISISEINRRLACLPAEMETLGQKLVEQENLLRTGEYELEYKEAKIRLSGDVKDMRLSGDYKNNDDIRAHILINEDFYKQKLAVVSLKGDVAKLKVEKKRLEHDFESCKNRIILYGIEQKTHKYIT